MNKALIKKYKTEFDHFINDGLLLVKYANPTDVVPCYEDWHEDDNVFESNIDYLIVINDEYIELRKALAEGKTIQTLLSDNKWYDVVRTDFSDPINKYRIKPEPTIKVGDWVKQVKENYSSYQKCFRIKSVVNSTTYIVEENIFDVDAIQNTDSQFELWKPEIGELCIEKESITESYFCVVKWKENSKWTPIPYTGTIPHFIKDTIICS